MRFQNLEPLKSSESLLRSLKFVIHQNLKHDAITVSNLVQNWSISTKISYSCRNVANWGTASLLQQMLNKSQMSYKWNKIYKTKKKETIHMLFFTISNLKSAKTYKSQWVLVSRKTVYSSISKPILLFPYSSHILCTILSIANLYTVLSMFPFFTDHLKAGTVHSSDSSLFRKRSIIVLPAKTKNEEQYTLSNIRYIGFQNSHTFLSGYLRLAVVLKR